MKDKPKQELVQTAAMNTQSIATMEETEEIWRTMMRQSKNISIICCYKTSFAISWTFLFSLR